MSQKSSEKNAMGKRIQELRKAAGLTQDQLAAKIGVSMAAVRNYENGLREPNSKAMVALERFFNVSGEYLRGNVDRDPIMENSAAIQGRLGDLILLFQSFKQDFEGASQIHQMQAISMLSGIMQTVSLQLLREGACVDLGGEEICQAFALAFDLNAQGRTELAKRTAELTQLPQYRR